MEEEQQPTDGDGGPCRTAETRKKRLALFIREESTSLSLVKVGAVNKQIIHCQREMADQPEVTSAAGEKTQSQFGNSPKLKEPTSGTSTGVLQDSEQPMCSEGLPVRECSRGTCNFFTCFICSSPSSLVLPLSVLSPPVREILNLTVNSTQS